MRKRNKKDFNKIKSNKKAENTVKGQIEGSGKGFAFLLLKTGDLYISAKNLNGARHGDTVLAKVSGDSAKVVGIILRGSNSVIGSYYQKGAKAYVVPDSRHYSDIPVKSKDIEQGTKVVVALKEDGFGTITEVLGNADDLKVILKSILYKYNYKDKFSKSVLKNAADACAYNEEDYQNRQDFRLDTVFTIDGEDSRDFDDAVSIKKISGGYILRVHIADVAHFVRHKSPLDNEALNRGTSVYFPFAVLPMLPKALSDDICSLMQDKDRLTLSVVMHINLNGDVYKYSITEGIIRSKARLTYPLAAAIIEGRIKEYLEFKQYLKEDVKEKLKLYKSLELPLKHMNDLCQILLKKRKERGAIEFESIEPYFTMDNGKVIDIKKAEQLISHKIIEEFMVLTNRIVAKHFSDLNAPFVYRVHQAPPPEKLARLTEFLSKIGLSLHQSEDNPSPSDFAQLLCNTPFDLKEVVSAVALRAMSKAEYSPQNKGHYGLSLENYCHFTSPIRRYPDLLIHRIIKSHLKDEPLTKYTGIVKDAADLSSVKERTAQEAEREVSDILTARFMADFMGESFEGMISGVTELGLFVRLHNTAEGLIRADGIKGFYRQVGYGIAAVDDKYYKLGQKVNVKLNGINGDKIEFLLMD